MTTFRRILADRTARTLAFTAGFAIAALLVAAFVAPTFTVDQSDAYIPPPSRAERLVERHDCWTDEAPAGVEPSRAVVTLPGERAELVAAGVGFGIWLEGDPGIVHAFCR